MNQQATLADVDDAVKNNEITKDEADRLRTEIRVRDHSQRFREATARAEQNNVNDK